MQGGGAERLMSQLANRWANQCEVSLITWSDIGVDQYPLDRRVKRIGLGLQNSSRGPINAVFANGKRVRELRKVLGGIHPELVVSFCDQMNIVCLEAMRRFPGVPVWIAEHSNPAEQRLSPVWEAWRGRSYPRCAGAVVLTDDIAKVLSRWVPQERILVIPPGLTGSVGPTSEYRTAANDGSGVLLYMGRLSPEKRVDVLLEAWRRIQPKLPGWCLQIVGDGSERLALQQTAQQLNEVQFCGWSDHPEKHYMESQIFVLPSRYEGFPLVLLEAMSFGLPCVATLCSSAIEQLKTTEDPQPLIVVPSSTVEDLTTDLARTLLQLAEDGPLRQRMSVNARQLSTQYSWDIIGALWDKLLAREAR